MRIPRALALGVPGLLACQPATTRPTFPPLPEAETVEIRVSPLEATRRLAEILQADSIPAARIELRDGFIESHWFEAASGKPTQARPLGTKIVRVRAWSDPGRPGFALLTVETVYRPVADPALPSRELDREVPATHPVAAKVHAALEGMLKRYGGPPAATPSQPRARPEEEEAPEPDESLPEPD